MATAGLDAPTVPIGADAKLRVTVETANQPVAKSTTQVQEKSSGPLQSILGSLAETRKYLPEQVYTFLDSMEGKTLEDLRVEAMSLAGRAQEEAKKRATEVTSRGKAVVDNANSKVQDVADKARERTNSVANELVQRVVQQPVEQTKEATRSIVQKAFQTGSNVAQQSWTLTQKQIIPRVQPYVSPVVNRARTYLPQTAEKFLKENVDGKTFDQLKNVAILNTRRNLLKIDKKDQPTLQQFATEVKEAAVTGQLFWNAFLLAEKAANNVFGAATKDVPENVGALRRAYNLSWQVTNGIKDYTTKQIMDARKQAMDAASSRVNAAKENATKKVNSVANSVVWQPMNNAKEAVAPVAERLNATVAPVVEKVGQTPVIPGFVYTALRGSETKDSEKPKAGELEAEKENTKTSEQVKTVPTTTVRVDIVGMQPADETKTSTTGAFSENKTASSGGNAKSMDLKDIKASATLETRDTNASSIGNLGTAGMGVTTTGSEAPTSNQGLASPTSSNKKSKGKHHQ